MRQSILAAIALGLVLTGPAMAQQGQPGSHFIENWDMDEDGRITPAEAREKRGEVFTMFDQDENGHLDDAEYSLFDETRQADMAANAGGHAKGPMKEVNQGLMRDFNDVNGDGAVSRQEFLDQSDRWFGAIDRNGDGVVSSDDFRGMGN